MKKHLLLLFALLAMAGMSVAQTVWSAGYIVNGDGAREAVVYQNGEIWIQQPVGATSHFQADDIVVDQETGDVYWAFNTPDSPDGIAGDVYKNNTLYNTLCATSSDVSHIYALAKGTHLYSVGYYMASSYSPEYAMVLRDDEAVPFAQFGNGTVDYYATGVFVTEDEDVYTCVNDYDGHAYVWKNHDALPLFDVEAVFFDVAVYDGAVYTTGFTDESGMMKAKVWKDGVELYTLAEGDFYVLGYKLKIYGGDIYTTSYEGSYDNMNNNDAYLWKNGQILYTIPFFPNGMGLDSWIGTHAIDVTPDGIYYTVDNHSGIDDVYGSKLYKDGEEIGSFRCLNDIFVVPEPCNNTVRTLPFTESFELGETDWTCWTKIDQDHTNAGKASYWDLGGSCSSISALTPQAGAHYARHMRNQNHDQEGWLVTPRISLPAGQGATMTFLSNTAGTPANGYASVWVSTSDDPTSISAYTQVWSLTGSNATWEEQTVDLSAYAGETVYIAFKYDSQGGTNALSWSIDEVNITEGAGWIPCDPISSFPYAETFDTEIDACWYLLDVDNDNVSNLSYWHWDDVNECAVHGYGPDGISQEGWMFSPRLQLAGGTNYNLSFYVAYDYPSDLEESSVWIAVDKTDTPAPADYIKIWEEGAPTEDWVLQNIDLSDYAGHTVNIAFKYKGTYAHAWYVDDVVVAEGLPQYTVSVASSNTAFGTVSGGGTFDQGTYVTIKATPNSGYIFLKWTKDGEEVSSSANYSFEVTEATSGSYTAWFGEPLVTYYTITAVANDATLGTVIGGGTYAAGTQVTLEAIPQGSNVFSRWSDGNTQNPRTITVTADAVYIANFEAPTLYNVTAIAQDQTMGTVVGGGKYMMGTVITIQAIPYPGYEFVRWNDNSTENPRTITVNDHMNFVAFFKNTGVGESGVTALRVYPNPANDNLHIEGLEADTEVQFYNSLGMMVKAVNVAADQEVNISDLAPGMYVIRCGQQMLRFVKE